MDIDERLNKILGNVIAINEDLNSMTVTKKTLEIVGRLMKSVFRTEELTEKPIVREKPKHREFKVSDYVPISEKELKELSDKRKEKNKPVQVKATIAKKKPGRKPKK